MTTAPAPEIDNVSTPEAPIVNVSMPETTFSHESAGFDNVSAGYPTLTERQRAPRRTSAEWAAARWALNVWGTGAGAAECGARLPNMSGLLEKPDNQSRLYRHAHTGETTISFIELPRPWELTGWVSVPIERTTARIDHPLRLVTLSVERVLAGMEDRGDVDLPLKWLLRHIYPQFGPYEVNYRLKGSLDRLAKRADKLAQEALIRKGVVRS